MKNLILTLFLLASTFVTYTANASVTWSGPYTITSVSRLIDGIHRVVVTVKEPMNTGCNVNDNTKTIKNYANNHLNVDGMLSVALTAQAQNKKIMVYLQGACNATHGLNLWGIKILSD